MSNAISKDAGNQPGREAWPLRSMWELRDLPDQELEWLVDELLPINGTSILVGPAKAGKSVLARNLGALVATGWGKWLGKHVKGGNVIHLSLDERRDTVMSHYRKLLDPEEEEMKRLIILTALQPRPTNIREYMQNAMSVHQPALVIVDTLFRFTRIDDGNDYAKVIAAMDNYTWLAESFDTHLMFIHHSNKYSLNPRIKGGRGAEILGSTALSACVDTVISLSMDGNQRQVYAYGRDNVDLEVVNIDMDENGAISMTGTKRAADEDTLRGDLITHLWESGEELTSLQLSKDLHKDKTSVIRALNNAMQDGDITMREDGRKKLWKAVARNTVQAHID